MLRVDWMDLTWSLLDLSWSSSGRNPWLYSLAAASASLSLSRALPISSVFASAGMFAFLVDPSIARAADTSSLMLSGIPSWSISARFAKSPRRVRAFAPFAILIGAWQPMHSIRHSKLYLPQGQVQSLFRGAFDPSLVLLGGRWSPAFPAASSALTLWLRLMGVCDIAPPLRGGELTQL
eukprot:7050634-Heterocapsa_arctica.AAC.1